MAATKIDDIDTETPKTGKDKGNKAREETEIRYEIVNELGVVSTSKSGWRLELNRVSWNGKEPKYDLRSWAPEHAKMGKGVTLTEEELLALADLLQKEVDFLKQE